MIFRLTDWFWLEGTPNVTCWSEQGQPMPPCLENRPGEFSRSMGLKSLHPFWATCSEFNCSHWKFFTSIMLEFPWLQPVAVSSCLLSVRLREGSDSVLAGTAHARERVCVMCECDLILANLSSFWFSSSVWLAQLSLCWGLMTKTCRRFMKRNILSHALPLTYFWKSFEKHWKYKWNSQFSPHKSSVIVVQLQRMLNMLNIL